MNDKDTSRRIHILRDSVAQKIAAGEVIDRPYSVVRELIDNSIDAGASLVDVSIEKGGLKRIRVADDGGGMEREDIELCVHPHATSKIEHPEDIYRLSTLGFRGEALASIAACSRLRITSAPETGEAHTLEIHEGSEQRLSPSRGKRGTVVEASDIFYSMPGRRKFLKSAGAETSACRKTLVEKALPYPGITFRFSKDGALDLHLPPATPVQRAADAHPGLFSVDYLYEIDGEAGDFSFSAVLSSPSLSRKDRRYIYIYVNGRRIQEYSLVQALEYAYRTVLPGGSYPVAFLFLSVNPELVDFNIHPAKREAKIKNLPAIHHEVVERVSEFLRSRMDHGSSRYAGWDAESISGPDGGPASPDGEPAGPDMELYAGHAGPEAVSSAEARTAYGKGSAAGGSGPAADRGGIDISRLKQVGSSAPVSDADGFIYRGQVLGVFLIAERRGEVLLIDQHAAHERIIYNSLLSSSGKRQPLLIAHRFEVEEDEEGQLEARLDEYAGMNIQIEQEKKGVWNLTAVPENCVGMEAEIVEFLTAARDSVSSMQAALYADIACKRAVKEGERLDAVSAMDLVRKSLSFPEPHCPNGRPVWIRLSEEELYRRIGRT